MPDAVSHPTRQELTAFGLGKLPEHHAATIAAHLASCPACREAVNTVPPDSFLDKVRDAGRGDASFPPSLAQPHNAPSSAERPLTPVVACPDLPSELARHPKYLILRELGRGGMGVVYQARHKEMDRQIVIKVINRLLLDRPDSLERFRREIRAAAQLSHPNIVTAYDAEQAGELHMLVMEFVPGQSLAEVVQKRGSLPVAHACLFARQVALGLQHAHERNMVHRDIKPQNLMLTLKNQVKILDFGLARVFREGITDTSTRLTSLNVYLGTPDYCAPEQALDARTADIRADLYSLGCTLYYLLSSRPPFREDTIVNTILAHQQKQPQPLPELCPEVPAELWQVIKRLLAKDPAQRYQKPIEVVQALAPFVKPGSKSDAKAAPAPAVGGGSPVKGTRISAGTNEIRKVLREVPAKTPPKGVPAKDDKSSPFTDLGANASPPMPQGPKQKGRKGCVLTAAASAFLALALMSGVIIKVKLQYKEPGKPELPPAEAILMLEIDQPGTEVFVDGQRRIAVKVPGDDGPIEIKLEPGAHKLRISKAGFVAVTKDIELTTGKSKPIRIRLERELPTPPVRPRDKVEDKWDSLFNGKDLDGWKKSPGSIWRVNESGVLLGSGATSSTLFTDRDDFADFHLRVEAMLGDGFNTRMLFRARGRLHYGVIIAGEPGPAQFPWPTGTFFREDTGEEGLRIAPKVDLQRGSWFKLEILARGTHFKVLVDDVEVVDYTAADDTRSRGAIGFTRRRTNVVKIRKIEIKELK